MLHSIRWKLVASYVFIAVVTVSIVGFVATEIVRSSATQRETEEMQASAVAIAHQAVPLLSPTPHGFPLSQLVRTTAFLGNFRVRILDAQHNPLVDSGLPGEWNAMVWIAPPQGAELISPDTNSSGVVIPLDRAGPGSSDPNLSELPPGTSSTVIRKSFGPWGGRISFDVISGGSDKSTTAAELAKPRSSVVVSELIGSANDPRGYVEISLGPNYSAEALATFQRAFWLAALGAGALAALIGLFIGSRLASPLRQLTSTAVEMGAGNLASRSTVTSKDEIGELSQTFNQMADRLQSSFQQLAAERDALRRFIADASHELRTPITALKNFNALLLGPAAGDPQAQEEFLAESQVQIERLEWITQNLLNLSRIDAGLIQLDPVDCEAGDLIQEASAPFKALAADKEIDLVIHPPEPGLKIRCDRGRMELVLSNLIDNAIKYTPMGGRVDVRGVASEEGQVRLSVRDTGPGISEEDLPHIFERFYRGRNATVQGSGLGLSIVASLVQAHGGKVWAESPEGGGALFVVEL